LERRIRAHSLTVENNDGEVLEEWRWHRRKWVQADAIASRNGVPLLPVRHSEEITLDTVNALRDEDT
jgi:hypothetical protein